MQYECYSWCVKIAFLYFFHSMQKISTTYARLVNYMYLPDNNKLEVTFGVSMLLVYAISFLVTKHVMCHFFVGSLKLELAPEYHASYLSVEVVNTRKKIPAGNRRLPATRGGLGIPKPEQQHLV